MTSPPRYVADFDVAEISIFDNPHYYHAYDVDTPRHATPLSYTFSTSDDDIKMTSL